MNLEEFTRGRLRRAADPGDVTVVAFAGGTGSGKSSLVNVLAGVEASEVGALRPTTSEVVAVLPAGTVAPALLDRLGVLRRAEGRQVGAVLCDLPDIDSIESGHVRVARAVLDHADAIVWVTDPEKYADAALHRLMDEYRDVPGPVVLSHADRLGGAGRMEVLADLERLVPDREILAVAVPPGGLPLGVGELADRIVGFEPLAMDHAARRDAQELFASLAPLPDPRPRAAWDATVAALVGAAEDATAAAAAWAPGAGASLARLGKTPPRPEPVTGLDVAPPWESSTPVVDHATAGWTDATEMLAETLDGALAMTSTIAIARRSWWLPLRVVTLTVAVLAVVGAVVIPDVAVWWGVVAAAVVLAVGWVVLGASGRRQGAAATAGLGERVASMFDAARSSEVVVDHLERIRTAEEVCADLERIGDGIA